MTNTDDYKQVAESIVDDLMTNGNGDKADRLVLELPDGRDGGGWSRSAAIDRVAKILIELNIPV